VSLSVYVEDQEDEDEEVLLILLFIKSQQTIFSVQLLAAD
jgi:hypothetical protein